MSSKRVIPLVLPRTQRILDKGENLTHREILYLQQRGITLEEIAEVMGVTKRALIEQMKLWKKRMREQGNLIEGME